MYAVFRVRYVNPDGPEGFLQAVVREELLTKIITTLKEGRKIRDEKRAEGIDCELYWQSGTSWFMCY